LAVISFDGEGVRFNYRVAGIIIEDRRVLLGRADWEDFWYLPGGRVEVRETASDSLARELREELGADAQVGRLVWVLENFFEFDGKPFHEIGLYFLASLPAAAQELRATEFERLDNGTRLLFRWAPLEELSGVRILPAFLVQALSDLPAETTHVVWRDERPYERA
jgi:8-oxo-dGTP pyrophosphatase MutT (NUDIX family)